jgi:hypothetical protein
MLALLAAMVIAALAPVTGLLGWQLHQELEARQATTQQSLQQAANEFMLSVNRELASSIDALTVLSQSELFQQGRIAAMGRLLQGRPRRDWDSVFLLDAKGAVVLDTAPRPAPPDSLRDLHAAAMRSGAPAVSGAGKTPGIAIAMPIKQADHVRYVLGVRLSDSVWRRLAANATLPEGGEVRLFDAQGHPISAAGDVGVQPLYAAWETVPLAAWKVRVALPAAPIDEARRHAIKHWLSTIGGALLAGAALAAVLGRAILRRAGR